MLTIRSVHLALVDRILPVLPKRLADKQEYIRAGAFYPDAFYDCMGKSEAAEEAHWPPFLAKGVQLVNQRRAQSVDTTALEAFLLGVLTHQIADISWHSLGIEQGLLKAMADSEFGGNYDDAHSLLDMGGDFLLIGQLGVDVAELTRPWKYNNADIKAVLRLAGHPSVSGNDITYCMSRGRAALAAEKKVATVGYKRLARRSPFVFDNLETYFAGGLTDMMQQFEECVPRFLAWTAGELDLRSPWDICQVFQGRKPRYADGGSMVGLHQRSLDSAVEVIRDLSVECKKMVAPVKPKLLAQASVIPAPALISDSESSVGSLYRPDFARKIVFWGPNIAISAPGEGVIYIYDENMQLYFKIPSPEPIKRLGCYATEFGQELAIWEKHLVVASPGASQLDFYSPDGEWCGGTKWAGSVRRYGARGAKFIGATLAVDNGFSELYVGAPYLDTETADQAGAIFLLPRALLARVVGSKEYLELPLEKHLISMGKQPYEQMARSIAITPRVVLVGSPGQSMVHGFDYSTHKRILFLKDPAARGDKPSGFGGNLLLGNKDFLVAGSPAKSSVPSDQLHGYGEAGLAPLAQRGVVTVYKNNRAHYVWGDQEFSWLGSNGAAAGNTVFLTSSHAYEGNGMIWKLDLKRMELKELGAPANAFASGLGASVATNGSIVIVGMPYYKNNYQDRLGAIAVFPVE